MDYEKIKFYSSTVKYGGGITELSLIWQQSLSIEAAIINIT